MKTLLFTISLAVGSLHALAAAEPVYCNGVPATIVATGPGTITGTTGNDVIVGSPGNDQIFGLEGNDLICGGGGSDTITGGRGDDEIYTLSGNDTIIWNPGDGNDRINTATGFDTLQMNLSNADEIIALSAVNGRLRLVRNIASITLDAGGIEKVNLPVVGGADHITVNNLSGTGVSEVVIDLAVVSGVGDGAADTIVVNGTVGADVLAITGSATLLQVSGGSPLVTIKQCEALNDTLIVNGLEGPDQLNALSIPAGVIKMKLDGGPGNDLINGSGGADELIAGPGDDTVRGGQGSDIVTLGAGNDTFLWLPGDSSDHIEGEAGTDIIQMTGSNAAENVELTASAGRLHLARDVGNVTVDAAGIERVHFAASGGADRITVDNLTGIGVSEITLDLAGGAGFGDVSVDTVIVRGTPDNDVIGISAPQGVITLNGPSTLLRILNPEPAYDVLLVEGKAGVDEIDAHSLPAGLIGLQITGGQGNDVLVGSQGNDTFIWNPGDGSDEIDGKAGLDTLQMYGSNAPENIELSAQGKRLILTRDVATVRHEVKATEVVNVNVSGGADRITIGDLTGTGVNRVAIQLANAAGLGDGQSDSIVVNGTNGNDAVIISGSAANLTIAGLAATIELSTLEAAFDSVRVNGLNGNDLLHAQNVPAGVVRLQL
ncbi:MAG: beta strand repeat-containing protein, partial [Bryobacteraceae bacterium]